MDTTQLNTSSDHFEIIKSEYDESRNCLNPTSRTKLARHLSEKTGLPYKAALQVVDQFCEEHSVPIPDYLSSEFNVGLLKVVSVVCVAFGIGLCIYGVQVHSRQNYPVGIWVAAAVFVGLGVFLWVRSLEAEVQMSKKDR